MEFKTFITNLGKYNEGELIGEWITFPIDDDELEEVLERIGINERYEEYFFTDYDANGLRIDEYSSIGELNELAEDLEYASDELILSITDVYSDNPYEVSSIIRNGDYCFYEDQSLEDVAYELVQEQIDCIVQGKEAREWVSRYFDYDQFERDLSFDRFYETDYGVLELY